MKIDTFSDSLLSERTVNYDSNIFIICATEHINHFLIFGITCCEISSTSQFKAFQIIDGGCTNTSKTQRIIINVVIASRWIHHWFLAQNFDKVSKEMKERKKKKASWNFTTALLFIRKKKNNCPKEELWNNIKLVTAYV